ncbi:MAG: hypothetical protein IKR86_09365 [Candidatus Methanomethylophilaceae archaeon]|nr:hypothetical protein [Candidatus Methanomethylophilaceae archaeon]
MNGNDRTQIETIPKALWPEVMREAAFGEWADGRDEEHPVQPGVWRGRDILVTYHIRLDEDTFDWTDEDWDAHIAGIEAEEAE